MLSALFFDGSSLRATEATKSDTAGRRGLQPAGLSDASRHLLKPQEQVPILGPRLSGVGVPLVRHGPGRCGRHRGRCERRGRGRRGGGSGSAGFLRHLLWPCSSDHVGMSGEGQAGRWPRGTMDVVGVYLSMNLFSFWKAPWLC